MRFETEVKRIYDSRPAYEWERLERHRMEFAISLRVLKEFLPLPPAKILDCGGGPGRYSIELALLGYQITLFDLSEGNLTLAKEKAAHANIRFDRVDQGTATNMSCYGKDTFDAVLLMGPLYHLLEEADRKLALSESYRVLKPGGLLFAAFITRFAPIRWFAVNDPKWVETHQKEIQYILETGNLPPRGQKDGEFVAYFAHPSEVNPMIERQGFLVKNIWGVEGLVSEIEEKVNQLRGNAWNSWVDLNYKFTSEPSLLGAAEHLLALAIKPE